MARATLPVSISCRATFMNMLMGMAKPIAFAEAGMAGDGRVDADDLAAEVAPAGRRCCRD